MKIDIKDTTLVKLVALRTLRQNVTGKYVSLEQVLDELVSYTYRTTDFTWEDL